MKLSRYFQELLSLYKSELDDLRSDSEGKDVLRLRLKEKREQLPFLVAMMGSNPEMLASAFHTGFLFMNPLVMEALISKEERALPTWASLTKAVKLEAWAEKLGQLVLAEEGGDKFLVTAAALEYLSRSQQTRQAQASRDSDDDNDEEHDSDEEHDQSNDGNYGRHGRDDGDDGDDVDLEEAGADWLAEQGFDRKE